MITSFKYPFLDLRVVNEPWIQELKSRSAAVIDSGRYVGGPEVEAFEDRLADLTGSDYVVRCANGLDAIRLIYRALIELGRLKPGDEVAVPSNTYIASILAVTDCGLKPLFVEPDPSTMNLSGASVRKALTPATKSVLTVHLYGRAAYDSEMEQLVRERNLILIEDNAQAIGADAFNGVKTGKIGLAGAFSFYPTKNIGALGDAGAVSTSDRTLAEAVRALANYGSLERYVNIYQGLNSRMDPLQAAFLNLKIESLEAECRRRRVLAGIYDEAITNPLVVKPLNEDSGQVWHQYVVRVSNRESFRSFLAERGVQTDVHYPLPPHRQQCYKEYAHLNLPIADKLASEVVSLPVSACTTPDDARDIAGIINQYRD